MVFSVSVFGMVVWSRVVVFCVGVGGCFHRRRLGVQWVMGHGIGGCALALAMRVNVNAVRRMMARVLAGIFLVSCSASSFVTLIII